MIEIDPLDDSIDGSSSLPMDMSDDPPARLSIFWRLRRILARSWIWTRYHWRMRTGWRGIVP